MRHLNVELDFDIDVRDLNVGIDYVKEMRHLYVWIDFVKKVRYLNVGIDCGKNKGDFEITHLSIILCKGDTNVESREVYFEFYSINELYFMISSFTISFIVYICFMPY